MVTDRLQSIVSRRGQKSLPNAAFQAKYSHYVREMTGDNQVASPRDRKVPNIFSLKDEPGRAGEGGSKLAPFWFWFLMLFFGFFEREQIVAAVGMWKIAQRFPRAVGKRGETVVWFSSLSTARHFHSFGFAFHALRRPIAAHSWRLASCMSRAASVSD
jgi:hypothetical protein